MKDFIRNLNIITVILFLLLVVGCCMGCYTDNDLARNHGGTAKIELEKDQRLITCSWKENSLWYLYEIDSTIKPRTYYYHEKSPYGTVEGTFIIVEK